MRQSLDQQKEMQRMDELMNVDQKHAREASKETSEIIQEAKLDFIKAIEYLNLSGDANQDMK